MSVRRLLLVLACAAWSAAAGAAERDLSPAEQRGKQIYVEGTSARGNAVTAFIGPTSVELPASAAPCGSCHGPDGIGRPEGGVIPTEITWGRLTKPYGAVRASAHRQHPPYDEALVARAIRAGVDPADNRLDSAMPRYRMDDEDMADLVAYLKRLQSDLDPGLSGDRIVVATVVPRGGVMAEAGQNMVKVLAAYFEDLNDKGGVYGRVLELLVASAATPGEAVEQARLFAESGEVFALVSPVTIDVDEPMAALAEEAGIPVVAPFTQSAPGSTGIRRNTFYVLSGPETLARALVEFAATRLPDVRISGAAVHPAHEQGEALAAAVVRQALNRGWNGVETVSYPAGDMDALDVVRRLGGDHTRTVFFLGNGAQFSQFASAADDIEWAPFTFLVGPLVGRDVLAAPERFAGRIYAAYPSSARDHTAEGRRDFGEFHQRHELPREHLGAQLAAYTAAKLLVEGLSQAGRSLSREKLVASLERLYEFDTGLTPPLTYGSNRHVGAQGAHVVGVDVKQGRFKPGSTWIAPE